MINIQKLLQQNNSNNNLKNCKETENTTTISNFYSQKTKSKNVN